MRCKASADHPYLLDGHSLLNFLLDVQSVHSVARKVAKLQELDGFLRAAIIALRRLWRRKRRFRPCFTKIFTKFFLTLEMQVACERWWFNQVWSAVCHLQLMFAHYLVLLFVNRDVRYLVVFQEKRVSTWLHVVVNFRNYLVELFNCG